MSVKKKRIDCKKKPVRKQWLEDLVVNEVMKVVMDDKAIEAIVSLRDCQCLAGLPEAGVRTGEGWCSLCPANPSPWTIQQGILTKSTKSRLEELEAAKEDLEIKIANEKLAKPKLTEEQILFYLHKFRVLDMSKQSHRQRLIDTFINRIYLYDDKLVITFNHKDGAQTITLSDIETALAEQENGSDLVSSAVP